MKKIKILSLTFVLLSIFCLFAFSGCKKGMDLEKYVNEIKSNVLRGESENYSVNIFIGKREDPYLSDGNVSTLKPFFIISVKTSVSMTESLNYLLEAKGKTYSGQLKLNPLTSAQCDNLKLDLDLKEAKLTLSHGENKESLTLNSVKTSKTISYKKALSIASSNLKSSIAKITENGDLKGEIQIRLLSESDALYYYVGITDYNGLISACLLDANSGKVLSSKSAYLR